MEYVWSCRYVPTDWATKVELTLEEVNKLNKLNLELASDLATRDPVYTPFQHGNFTCIMIKEVCVCVRVCVCLCLCQCLYVDMCVCCSS